MYKSNAGPLSPRLTRWQVHVDRTATLATQNGETTAAARKLKHRFTEQQLEKVMDEVERA